MSAAVEDRLRAALAARAGQVTAADLQPVTLPSRPARRSLWTPSLALAGLAVAATAIVVVLLVGWRPQHPSPPADTPAPIPTSSPAQSPAQSPAPTRSAAVTGSVGPSASPTRATARPRRVTPGGSATPRNRP